MGCSRHVSYFIKKIKKWKHFLTVYRLCSEKVDVFYLKGTFTFTP